LFGGLEDDCVDDYLCFRLPNRFSSPSIIYMYKDRRRHLCMLLSLGSCFEIIILNIFRSRIFDLPIPGFLILHDAGGLWVASMNGGANLALIFEDRKSVAE